MSPERHFEHVVQSIAQQTAYFIRQLPPHYLARFDRDQFFSSFSMVVDNVRVQLPQSPHRTGWSGNDTMLGTTYSQDFNTMSPLEIMRLHNSDRDTEAPYGNDLLLDVRNEWNAKVRETSDTIPICVLAEAISGSGIIGGSTHARNGLYYCTHSKFYC
jgi:hypothetical protein